MRSLARIVVERLLVLALVAGWGGQAALADVTAILVELQPAVAAFFDKGGVMVMDPDPALRENRLSLLSRILQPFMKVADFRLASGATTVGRGPATGSLAS